MKQQEENKEKKQPTKKFRAGPVSSTIWENQAERDGETNTFYTISVERNYKDKDGSWKSTNSFRVADLPRVELAVKKAFEHLVLRDAPVHAEVM